MDAFGSGKVGLTGLYLVNSLHPLNCLNGTFSSISELELSKMSSLSSSFFGIHWLIKAFSSSNICYSSKSPSPYNKYSSSKFVIGYIRNLEIFGVLF